MTGSKRCDVLLLAMTITAAALLTPVHVNAPTLPRMGSSILAPSAGEKSKDETLDPEAERIARYLARQWTLGEDYAREVASGVLDAASRHQLDPMLLLAVAAKESSFRHDVGNPDGGADPKKPYGIMQVYGRWHADKFPEGEVRKTTLRENIDLGAQILKDYITLKGGELKGIMRYHGASAPLNEAYLNRVQRFRRQFSRELRGDA